MYIIGICGGTASGKTTFTQKLVNSFNSSNVKLISMDNFYTVTVYNKGAEVIRMIKTIIGSDAFAKGMDLYFDTYDGQAVEINDFAASMEQASGLDLTQFKRWYSQSGTPELRIKGKYEKKTKKSNVICHEI